MDTIYSLLLNASPDKTRPCLLGANGVSVSFGDLLQRISAISAKLAEAGMKRDSAIGIAVPNGPDLATAMISVSCCAICVPLPDDDPDTEVKRNISSLNLGAMLVSNRQSNPAAQTAERLGVPVIALDEISDESMVGANAFDPPSPNDTALIFSTSGSTSAPKIVPLSHSNIAHAIAGTRESLGLTSQDRSLNVLSLIHIHGFVGGLLSCLSAGGSVICTPKFEAAHFFDWIEDLKPTFLTAVPPIHKEIATLATDNPDRAQSHSLRFVRTASAPMPLELADRVEQVLGIPMVISYGMTEASPLIASGSPDVDARRRGSVGKPSGTEVRIVKDHAHICDPFEEGEIEIRGASVFSGYLNNTDQNRDWSDDGWFRTGDLGYMDSEHHLFVSGRLNEIINRGGSKVSPARIDEIMRNHPEVAGVAAFPVNHPTLGQDLVCAVVREGNSNLTAQALIDFLVERLPSSHRPSRIVFVEEIPTTATGKLLRYTLSDSLSDQLVDSEKQPDSANSESTGSMYDSVARIWEEVLEKPVSESTDFFAAGGDSLTMIRCLAELNEMYDTLFPIDTFLDNTVMGDFVTSLEQELEASV